MKEANRPVPKKQMPAITLLLGIAVVATTAAFLLLRFANERAYRKKWAEYDECGLA